MRNNNSVRSAD